VKVVVGEVALGGPSRASSYRTDVSRSATKVFRNRIPAPDNRTVSRIASHEETHPSCHCVRARGAVGPRRASLRAAGSGCREAGLWGAAAVAMTFLALPVLAILLRVSPTRCSRAERSGWTVMRSSSRLPDEPRSLRRWSYLGTPTAYLLATSRFRGPATCC